MEDHEDWPVYELNVERCPHDTELTETGISFVGQFRVVDVGPLMRGSDGAKDLREVLTTEGGAGSMTFSFARFLLVWFLCFFLGELVNFRVSLFGCLFVRLFACFFVWLFVYLILSICLLLFAG